eukprot:GHVU01168934.1.p1 GENE.GHVU01168934.1~~GHVU01168934.1.p1  ORF type:complete len:671 (+),score=129.68 GHVU01168934.1:1578-3590(+)
MMSSTMGGASDAAGSVDDTGLWVYACRGLAQQPRQPPLMRRLLEPKHLPIPCQVARVLAAAHVHTPPDMWAAGCTVDGATLPASHYHGPFSPSAAARESYSEDGARSLLNCTIGASTRVIQGLILPPCVITVLTPLSDVVSLFLRPIAVGDSDKVDSARVRYVITTKATFAMPRSARYSLARWELFAPSFVSSGFPAGGESRQVAGRGDRSGGGGRSASSRQLQQPPAGQSAGATQSGDGSSPQGGGSAAGAVEPLPSTTESAQLIGGGGGGGGGGGAGSMMMPGSEGSSGGGVGGGVMGPSGGGSATSSGIVMKKVLVGATPIAPRWVACSGHPYESVVPFLLAVDEVGVVSVVPRPDQGYVVSTGPAAHFVPTPLYHSLTGPRAAAARGGFRLQGAAFRDSLPAARSAAWIPTLAQPPVALILTTAFKLLALQVDPGSGTSGVHNVPIVIDIPAATAASLRARHRATTGSTGGTRVGGGGRSGGMVALESPLRAVLCSLYDDASTEYARVPRFGRTVDVHVVPLPDTQASFLMLLTVAPPIALLQPPSSSSSAAASGGGGGGGGLPPPTAPTGSSSGYSLVVFECLDRFGKATRGVPARSIEVTRVWCQPYSSGPGSAVASTAATQQQQQVTRAGAAAAAAPSAALGGGVVLRPLSLTNGSFRARLSA